MIFIAIFGLVVIGINIFLIEDTVSANISSIHWALLVAIALVALVYFVFIVYLVSTVLACNMILLCYLQLLLLM